MILQTKYDLNDEKWYYDYHFQKVFKAKIKKISIYYDEYSTPRHHEYYSMGSCQNDVKDACVIFDTKEEAEKYADNLLTERAKINERNRKEAIEKTKERLKELMEEK